MGSPFKSRPLKTFTSPLNESERGGGKAGIAAGHVAAYRRIASGRASCQTRRWPLPPKHQSLPPWESTRLADGKCRISRDGGAPQVTPGTRVIADRFRRRRFRGRTRPDVCGVTVRACVCAPRCDISDVTREREREGQRKSGRADVNIEPPDAPCALTVPIDAADAAVRRARCRAILDEPPHAGRDVDSRDVGTTAARACPLTDTPSCAAPASFAPTCASCRSPELLNCDSTYVPRVSACVPVCARMYVRACLCVFHFASFLSSTLTFSSIR